MGLGDLAVLDGAARQWCRRAIGSMVTHRVLAWATAAAALYACGVGAAGMHQREALSALGLTIATLVYLSFAVVPIVGWPPCLPVAATTPRARQAPSTRA